MPTGLYDNSMYDNYIDYVMNKPKKEKTNQSPYMIVAPKPEGQVNSLSANSSIVPKPTINDYVKSQQKMMDSGPYPRVPEEPAKKKRSLSSDGQWNPAGLYDHTLSKPTSDNYIAAKPEKKKQSYGPYPITPFEPAGKNRLNYINFPWDPKYINKPKKDYYTNIQGDKIGMKAEFDGNNLSVIRNITSSMRNSTKSDTLKLRGYSGRPIKDNESIQFDYSRKRQAMKNTGPLPEGNYWINPQEIIKNESLYLHPELWGVENTLNTMIATLPRKYQLGRWKGGTRAWGKGRIDINPRKVNIDGVERSDFTIHGGEDPGSAGCVDIMNKDQELFDYLERHRGRIDSIPLKVNYQKK